jgi:hypothetical protein
MKKLLLALLCFVSLTLYAAQPYREITMPTVAEATASFAQPPEGIQRHLLGHLGRPAEQGAHHLGHRKNLCQRRRRLYDQQFAQRANPQYLSPEYMDLVKTVVQECKKRGMKVWIEGDCGYPDGFAGGLISKEVSTIGHAGHRRRRARTVAAGQTLDIPLPPDTLGIVANPRPATAPSTETPTPTTDATTGKPFPIPAGRKFQIHGAARWRWGINCSVAQRRRALQPDGWRTVRHPSAA